MKYFFLFLLTFVSLANSANGFELNKISIGPTIGFKAGVNGIQTPSNRKNAVAFASMPDIGANLFMPFSESNKIGLDASILFSNYAFGLKNYNKGITYNHHIKYVSINPNLYFNGMLFGFSLGIPLAADYDGVKLSYKRLNMTFEFVIGGKIELKKFENGTLNAYVKAGYMLTGVFDDYAKNDSMHKKIPASNGQIINDDFNPRPISLHIGFNYLFDLDI